MSEIKILVEYSVKENKLNDFLTEIKNNKIREKVLEEKGCISYDCLVGVLCYCVQISKKIFVYNVC